MSPDLVFDSSIEDRINMEIIVDANCEDEVVTGWLNYLVDELRFPFQAKCIKKINTSPLDIGETVTVVDMDSQNCEHDMFVTINWNNRVLSVPLSQLEGLDIGDQTLQAITDWHYWVNSGRSF